VHGKPAEVNASALDALFGIELETVAVEKWPGRETDVGNDARRTNGAQRGLDALTETAGNSAAGKRGMSEEKVQVAVVRVGSEAREHAIQLGDDGVKPRQTLLPACSVGWDWCPRGNLLR